MADSSDYIIVFSKMDDVLASSESQFNILETLIEDEKIRELAIIINQFNEDQTPAVFTSA